jgi:hypothetical protein
MAEDTTTQRLMFPDIFPKPVVAEFDQERGSSDGGAVLLKAADRRLGLTSSMASCLKDERESGKVRHEVGELLSQRVFTIACGYPDGNDADRLSDDPIQKMLVSRDPIEGDALASQPTLSRFENRVSPRELYRLGEAIADTVIERHRRRLRGHARLVTIDMDPTDDPTHGQQQLSFFNGHYDCRCYLPMLVFATFDDESEQYLLAAVLRPGNAPVKLGAIGLLRRIIARVRKAFPKARIRIRMDGGFACPEMFEFLDEANVEYLVAMAKNLTLEWKADRFMRSARKLSRESGETAHVYGESRYSAKKWSRERRVIIKAEVVRHPGREPKDNPRFVITNLTQTPQWIYERIYCQRGDVENRIKELHHGLEIDRTSCSRFWANQFRVLLTAASYVLMQEIRLRAAKTAFARAQVSTLRERLLKIGVHVVVSVRRIVLHFPSSFPDRVEWLRIAYGLGAMNC